MNESNTNNNDIDNQQDQQEISQEELSKQRIQKRKEDAKRIMDERKKRELQQPPQRQQQYDQQQDDEIDEMPQKHKRYINDQQQQQQDGDIDDQQQTSYDQAPKISQRKVPLPPMVQPQSIKSPSSSNPNLREDMVKKAVLFLNNPNVKNTALGRKVAYLEKKGLTTDEVKEALKRIETGNISGTSTSTSAGSNVNSLTRAAPLPPYQQQQQQYNNNNNYNNQLQAQQAQQQVQYYQQQQQMATTQITSYQKRLEADDARIAQLMHKNNGISWNSILYSVTAIVGAASGLAYLTSNYIVPYINGNKIKLASENVEKKISDLQEEIIKLQSTIITQGNEFKDTTKSLKSLIEQQQQQLSQQQQLTTTTASTISATSSSNTTEIFEIKKELRNLTSLINNNNNSNSNNNNNNNGTSKYNGFNGIYNKSEPDTPSSSSDIKPNTAPGSNLTNTNRSIPPIVKSNPYSHLSWKPPTDQPPVIPSWQQKDTNPPQPTNSSINSAINSTTTPTIPTINSNPPTPTKPIYQSSYNYGDVNSLGGNLKFDETITTNKSPIDLTSTTPSTSTTGDIEQKNTTTTTTTTTSTATPTSTTTPTTAVDPTKPADETPYSSDFLDVINQLKQGKTPPGIRTDIDDKPMENATVTKSAKERPKKPWEKDSLTSIAGNLSTEETKTIVGSNLNTINSNHTLPSFIDYSDDDEDDADVKQSIITKQQQKDENDNNNNTSSNEQQQN